MAKVTTKRKAEGPSHKSKAIPAKKLKRASCQLAPDSPPRPASTTDSSFSESSSIDDSSSSAASSFTDKSFGFTASIEKSSLAPSATAAYSTSALQETQPDDGGALETEDWDKLFSMSWEEVDEYIRRKGWKSGPCRKRYLVTECDPGYDVYDMEIDAMKTGRPLQWVDCGEVSGDDFDSE